MPALQTGESQLRKTNFPPMTDMGAPPPPAPQPQGSGWGRAGGAGGAGGAAGGCAIAAAGSSLVPQGACPASALRPGLAVPTQGTLTPGLWCAGYCAEHFTCFDFVTTPFVKDCRHGHFLFDDEGSAAQRDVKGLAQSVTSRARVEPRRCGLGGGWLSPLKLPPRQVRSVLASYPSLGHPRLPPSPVACRGFQE